MMLESNEWIMVSRVTDGAHAGDYAATLYADTGELDVDGTEIVQGIRCREIAEAYSHADELVEGAIEALEWKVGR